MTLPGFSAENSLSSVGSGYRTVGAVNSAAGGDVVPQFWCHSTPGGPTICCQCFFGWCDCRPILRHVLM
jgi:hypothetical protein